MFVNMQNINFTTQFFLEIAKTLYTCYYEYFRHAWPGPSKIIVSIYRKL